MNASIDQTAISLGMATLMGASIVFERQWRQRMAGLRTNTLVATGAATFVIFAGSFPDEGSPTRWRRRLSPGSAFWAQEPSFARDFTSPASTPQPRCGARRPWGCWREAGRPLHAALATSFVVLVNLTLRPLVRITNRQPITQAETDFHYRVRVVCPNPEEAHVRALLLQSTSNGQLSLRRLNSTDLEDSGRVNAQLTAQSKSDAVLEQVVGRLSLEPTVSAASWSVEPVVE